MLEKILRFSTRVPDTSEPVRIREPRPIRHAYREKGCPVKRAGKGLGLETLPHSPLEEGAPMGFTALLIGLAFCYLFSRYTCMVIDAAKYRSIPARAMRSHA